MAWERFFLSALMVHMGFSGFEGNAGGGLVLFSLTDALISATGKLRVPFISRISSQTQPPTLRLLPPATTAVKGSGSITENKGVNGDLWVY